MFNFFKKKGLIPFIIPFYPNKKIFLKVLNFFLEEKIKIFEVGFPCFDSYGDGKIISKAYRCLKFNFFKTISIFKKYKEINFCCIILICYSNVIENFGIKNFLKSIKKCFDAILIIDQPIEYVINYNKLFVKNKIRFVCLINFKEKKQIKITLNKIISKMCLFIYLASNKGATGKKKKIDYKNLKKNFFYIKKHSNLPVVIGFSIDKTNIKFISSFCKNYIVGSFLIHLINKKFKYFKIFVRKYKK